MSVRFTPIHNRHERGHAQDLAAQASGIDLRSPIDPADAAAIEAALASTPVLLFRDQFINDEQQIAFTSIFGTPHLTYAALVGRFKRRIERTDMSDIANLDENGDLLKEGDDRRVFSLANRVWHADTTFQAVPSKVGILTARELPSKGGNTEFADMRAAWDALPPAQQMQCEPLVLEHSTVYSRGKLGVKFSEEEKTRFPPVPHPLVRINGHTGRKSLYMSHHASHVIGMPVDEGRALIQQLTEHATSPPFCYIHEWKMGDLVIWDNRCTMHRAAEYEEFKERRVLARTGVNEQEAPIRSREFR